MKNQTLNDLVNVNNTQQLKRRKCLTKKEKCKINAKVRINPTASASIIIKHFHQDIDMEADDIFDGLIDQRRSLRDKGMQPIEEMLWMQAHALQAVFEKASIKIANCESLAAIQTWGAIAMKAQTQCRQTLIALADIKNPRPIAFIKQLNNGITQQVNNVTPKDNSENFEKSRNELLSEANDEALDIGRKNPTISANKTLEALEISRRKDSWG